MNPTPADEIEAWLAQVTAPQLADDDFSAAVMRRIQAEETARRPVIEAERALAQLRARAASQRRAARWRLAGTAAGALLAVGVMGLAGGGLPAALAPPQILALLFGLSCAAWWLTDGAAREA